VELNELRIFKAVAEEGSVSRAARRLNYVQSNVSARIRQLEENLNISLFHRKSRGVVLTPVGHVFLDYAKRIISLSDEAMHVVQERDEPVGMLTIGSMEATAVVHLPPILSEYHCRCPLVDLNLLTGTSEQVLTYLLDYRVDGAFVGGIVDHPDLFGEVIIQEELVMAVAKGKSPFDKKERQTILVFRKGCAFRARLEAWLQESGILPYRIMEFSSVESILGCVLSGLGMTFLPRSVFLSGKYDDTIDLYLLPAQVAAMPINFVTRKVMAESKALEAFRSILKEKMAIRPKKRLHAIKSPFASLK
jgi:DNA-binding transcriptional LysR family regulator